MAALLYLLQGQGARAGRLEAPGGVVGQTRRGEDGALKIGHLRFELAETLRHGGERPALAPQKGPTTAP